MLDPIHNQGLTLALGAFRTSPVASLYVEADEPSLYSLREKLSLQYAIRLAANPSNPAHDVTFPTNRDQLIHQHCYTGSRPLMQHCLKIFPNTYFGFKVPVAKYLGLMDSVSKINESRLLKGTDAPYFAMGGYHL